MASKEASARIKINKLLEESGWRFFDDDNGRANVQLETGSKVTKQQLDDMGDDFENVTQGFLDYLLIGNDGFPLVVLEAKREGINPLSAKKQAREYAKSLHAPFVILSNGNSHYLWDVENGNPELITKLPTPLSLSEIKDYRSKPESLADYQIGDDYIALSQNPKYADDPLWTGTDADKQAYIAKNKLRFLRPYQVNAITAIQKNASLGKMRYLLEMATGTGKTLTTAAIIKLFLKSGNAKRVLFLVDRIELEDQAQKAFVEYLKNEYTSVIYKRNKDDWRKAEIVVSTVQSLQSNERYRSEFSPTDFELVISDEAHRSINGNARAVFEYFIGYKLGLTATPKDYLKHHNQDDSPNSQRAFERRQLLDTYKTFGCDSGEPTYRYSLLDGVKDGYLINPVVVDARTDITTELLSETGYSVHIKDEDGDKEETYFARQFERKFFNDLTNVEFCKTFLKHAFTDPITGEVGKTLIFCVSQNHAAKITNILNKLASQLWPDKYSSDFAEQVTSYVTEAQTMTTQFTNNNLNGLSKWQDGYKSSKTRICVTVGMMTTGYDCPDILNLVMMRPIFSPSDFIQMKGRGTRKYNFTFEERTQDKANFKLFDFFGNCEYFEEGFDYDEELSLPPEVAKRNNSGKPPTQGIDELLNLDEDDPLKTLKAQTIDEQGMKIDREAFGVALREDIQSKVEIKNAYELQDFDTAEELLRTEVINQPKHHLTLDKARNALDLDRRVTLRELLHMAFDPSYKPKSKDELLNDEFDKFVLTEELDPEKYDVAKTLFKSYTASTQVEEYVDSGDYSMLEFTGLFSQKEMQEMDENVLKRVPSYVKDYVATGRYR